MSSIEEISGTSLTVTTFFYIGSLLSDLLSLDSVHIFASLLSSFLMVIYNI